MIIKSERRGGRFLCTEPFAFIRRNGFMLLNTRNEFCASIEPNLASIIMWSRGEHPAPLGDVHHGCVMPARITIRFRTHGKRMMGITQQSER